MCSERGPGSAAAGSMSRSPQGRADRSRKPRTHRLGTSALPVQPGPVETHVLDAGTTPGVEHVNIAGPVLHDPWVGIFRDLRLRRSRIAFEPVRDSPGASQVLRARERKVLAIFPGALEHEEQGAAGN